MDGQTTIDVMVANWEMYQDKVIEALAPLSAGQMALRAAPHLRSIAEIAAHMVSARAWWMSTWLGEGGPDMAGMVDWDDDGMRDRSPAEIAEGLTITWAAIKAGVARWSPAETIEPITQVHHGHTRTITRAWVIWHLIEHDIHHGGEIGLTLGVHGLAAPDL